MLTCKDLLQEFESLKEQRYIKVYQNNGVTVPCFGIALGKIRPYAKKIKINHELGLELWNTNMYEPMILACMILDPKQITVESAKELLLKAICANLVDELSLRVIAESKVADELMNDWMKLDDPILGRAGWNFAVCRVKEHKFSKDEMDAIYLDVEKRMKTIHKDVQWAMNYCFCMIAIENEDYTQRGLEIGEKLGVYKELKVSKGCTSAYAVEWINKGIERTPKKA